MNCSSAANFALDGLFPSSLVFEQPVALSPYGSSGIRYLKTGDEFLSGFRRQEAIYGCAPKVTHQLEPK